MIFVQARERSVRFPKKVLQQIGGRKLILRVISASLMNRSGHAVAVLLPSDEGDSNLLTCIQGEFAQSVHVEFGSHANLYSRFLSAFINLQSVFVAEPAHLGIIRVCADRPFLQPAMIDALDHRKFSEDLLYNHVPPEGQAGPRGLGAESLSRDLASRFFTSSTSLPVSAEHVTSRLYQSWQVSKRYVIPENVDPSSLVEKFDVDTIDDLEETDLRVRKLSEAWPEAYVE